MQTIQNTQAKIKSTTTTMSLLQLNSQIMKANSKLFVEFARNFGEDLLGDLMNVMKQLHNENQNKTERPSVEESFELMQEHFHEVLDSRIEHMSNEVPRSVRGRKPNKTIVAVDDTDDEGEKRGRPKKEEAKLEQTGLDSEQQQVLANAKKAAAKPNKATAPKKKSKGKEPKKFRRIERTVVKKDGKEKREKVWRKPDYELKEGEVFLNTWAVSEKTPNSKTPTFDNESDAFKALNGEQVAQPTMTTIVDIPAQPKKTEVEVVEKVIKQVVEEVVAEVVQKPVEELEADTYQDEGVETDGDEGIDGIENDEETTVEVKTTTDEKSEDDKIDIQKTFNPTEPYAPFTGVDEMVGKLIRFTDKTSVNYGKIINKETLQVFGWVDPNDDEQYVEEQPDYVEEEENDDDEDVLDCDWDF